MAQAQATTAVKASAPAKTGATVVVGCKLPNGLELRLQDKRMRREPVLGGGTREFEESQFIGKAIIINGNAVAFGQAPHCQIVEGAALTFGVDADFIAKWLEQNADHPAVLNNLIFVHSTRDGAEGLANDYKDIKSGLEPLIPDTDPRTKSAGKMQVTTGTRD